MKKNYLLALLLCIGAIFVASSQTINANDDNVTINGVIGGNITTIRHNDVFNGIPGTQAPCNAAVFTLVSSSSPNITLTNPCGTLTVAPGTPVGTYTVTYQICLTSSPAICDTATATINVCAVANPVITVTTPGGCTTTSSQVQVSNLPATGNWTLYYRRNNQQQQQVQGTGPTTSLSLPPGEYTFWVTAAGGCESADVYFYSPYPEQFDGELNAIYVDTDNNGQINVGDHILYEVTLINPLDCDIVNISPVGGGLVTAGTIPVLPAGTTNTTSITAYHVITQQDINNNYFEGMIFISGTYNGNEQAYTKLFKEFSFNISRGIRMVAFIDTNSNGIKDNGEENFNGGNFSYQLNNDPVAQVYSYNGEHTIYENNSGNQYTLNYVVANQTCSGQYTVQVPAYTNITTPAAGITTYNFPLTAIPCTDAQVYISTSGPVPGMPYYNYIAIHNAGNQPVPSGTLTYTAPSGIPVQSVSEAGAITTATGFTWTYPALNPGEHHYVNVILSVPTIPNVQLGDMVTSVAAISAPAGDTNTQNNTFTLTRAIVGSYDPNDKSESHGGRILHSAFTTDDYLTYTIRFENTGNGPANFIRITDELESGLNPATLRMVASSHNYMLERSGNSLEWRFNNIQLPPSQPNSTIGHGYVTFQIKPMAGYAVGDIISNSAAIFFDTNPAIITNTVTTEFVATMGTGEVAETSVITLYPNPAANAITIETAGNEIYSLSIFDVTGKVVMQQANPQSNIFNITSLSPGMYFVKVALDTGVEKTIKVMKQ